MLATNIASVEMQIDNDYNQVFIDDPLRLGLYAANCNLYSNRHRVTGKYVYILDDDTALIVPDFVSTIRQLAKNQKCDIIMVKSYWLATSQGRVILPRQEFWQRPPVKGQIDTLNFIVRNGVWQRHIHEFCQPRCGDFHFAKALFEQDYSICWLDEIMAATQQIGSLTGR